MKLCNIYYLFSYMFTLNVLMFVCVIMHVRQIRCTFEPRCEKQVFGVSDQVRRKPGCTATEDGKRLEISDLESRGIVLSV